MEQPTRNPAKVNWDRYEYARSRGHKDYTEVARLNEGFYLGGGLQWSHEDRELLAEQRRPAFEFNQIMPKINAALGYQIANRMDIAFRPRGGDADQEIASVLSKVVMQIADNNHLHWKESVVFADGLIQQRGYYEVRVSYANTMLGEVKVSTLDPLDVIPDPDAKSYDPDDWADVIITKWLTYDEIEALYGTKKRRELEAKNVADEDFGNTMMDEERNKFGTNAYIGQMGVATLDDGSRRVRVIDRQFWQMTQADVIITPLGDIRLVDGMNQARLDAMLAQGAIQQKRRVKRVRWVVSTQDVVLFEDWSPFAHFTVVPYFPLFRRGVTRGLVDNARDPQQLLNKSMSSYLHTTSTTANSGWIVKAGTLVNMREDELEDRGAETGLVMVVSKTTPQADYPQKIQPNQIPSGLDRMIERSAALVDQTTGINSAMQGVGGPEVSGIAIQSRQYAAQQQLSVPLDNLGRTRDMLANRILDLVQSYYDDARIIRITEQDERGRDQSVELAINYPMPDGGVLNDVTLGEYDVVISEVPMQVTFENSQFLQAIEMRDKGIAIPDAFILQYSNLARKQELIDAMEQQGQPQPNPIAEAEAQLKLAQAGKEQALAGRAEQEGVAKAVEAAYSAIQTAATLAANPPIGALADAILGSAGFVDQDAGPVIPSFDGPGISIATGVPRSTDPLTPTHPGLGLNRGIETPEIEGAPAT